MRAGSARSSSLKGSPDETFAVRRRAWRRRQRGTIATRLCCASMKTLNELLGHIALVGLLILGLAAGSVWLIRSDQR